MGIEVTAFVVSTMTIAALGISDPIEVGEKLGGLDKSAVMGVCLIVACVAVAKLYYDMHRIYKDMREDRISMEAREIERYRAIADRDTVLSAALNNFATAATVAKEADHAVAVVIGKMVDVIQTCEEHSKATAPKKHEMPNG